MIAKIPSGGVGSRWQYAPIEEQPRAVILDPRCHARLNKLFDRVSKKQVPTPWILCRDDFQMSGESYVPMKAYDDGKFKWEDILSTLSVKGVNLLMIEGGAVVINDVLAQRMADVIIVSISPVFLGRDGVGIQNFQEPEWLEDVQVITLGRDVVFAGRANRDKAEQK